VETLNLTTRNNAEQRETTCGYAEGVDGINTLQPPADCYPDLLCSGNRLPGRHHGPGGLPLSHHTVWDRHVATVVGNKMMIELAARPPFAGVPHLRRPGLPAASRRSSLSFLDRGAAASAAGTVGLPDDLGADIVGHDDDVGGGDQMGGPGAVAVSR
jgi:hypothetical protein